MRELGATGTDAVALATQLLQRARLADPTAGIWEAADVQWWWRTPRASDGSDQLFWLDEDGPVAGVLATEFRGAWQVDPLLVDAALLPAVRERTAELVDALDRVEVPVRDDAEALLELVRGAGLVPGERSAVCWMDAADRPAAELPDGFVLVDRAQPRGPHPMRARNGASVEERLRQCPLYDPRLDLAVETEDGEVAGYSLYWFDPVTRVGLLEPMRVEDAFQRRGLARAMIATGLERLARRGAERMKVGYSTDTARALYTGCGFRVESTSSWYVRP